jgi:nucleotide-binding universal stress UspA family protein
VTIALGFDGGESAQRALDAAIGFARDLEEPILVVCGVAPAGGMGEEYQTTEAAVVDELSPAVLEAVARIQALGLAAEAVLVDSDPVGALETVMVERQPRMLIVGYGQSGRIRAALFGAVAHRIVESSDVPVLVVP